MVVSIKRSSFPRPASLPVQTTVLLAAVPVISQTGSPPLLKCGLAAEAAETMRRRSAATVRTANAVRRMIEPPGGVPPGYLAGRRSGRPDGGLHGMENGWRMATRPGALHEGARQSEAGGAALDRRMPHSSHFSCAVRRAATASAHG